MRSYRKRLKWSQKAVAEASGCSETYLSRIENGLARPRNKELLERFVDALQLKPAERRGLLNAASQSQRVIRLKANLTPRAFTLIHRLVGIIETATDDGLSHIEDLFPEEPGEN